MNNIIIKVVYVLFIVFPYAVILTVKRDKKLSLKKKHKYDKYYAGIIDKCVMILPCIMLVSLPFDNAVFIVRVDALLLTSLEIIAFVLLDNDRRFKYKFAIFYFYDGDPIKDIATNKICQKGNWIIAADKNSEKEYRFRTKDIKRVEYSNSACEDICET